MQPARLRRHEDRANYDWEAIRDLFSNTFLAHVAYVDDGEPVCLPMIALPYTLDDTPAVYLHGHPTSRLMELVRKAEKDATDEKGENCRAEAKKKVKVCITATKVDGLVLSSAPNGHTFNYRSGIVHGHCSLVTSPAAKSSLMHAVTNHIVANRWEDVNPVSSMQLSFVCIVRVHIDRLSLKSRHGIPGIQPRQPAKDGPDKECGVWTGVVPVYERLEQPIESGLTPGVEIPESLKKFIKSKNDSGKQHSMKAAT